MMCLKNLVFSSLVNFEPVKRILDRCNMMKFGRFRDGTSSSIKKNKLWTVSLSYRKVHQKRIAVVKFRMRELALV